MRIAAAALMIIGDAAVLAAHDGPHPVTDGGPSVWDAAALAALAASAVLYALGSRRLAGRGVRLRRIERASFWAGWAALVVAVGPPMDAAASALFSVHMVQHELLMLVGAPLAIAGRPMVPWLWAMPARLRPVAAAALQRGPLHAAWRWATVPVIAWALHGATIWTWHVPAFYQAAVESEAIHAFQHVTFVATAVCFWWGLVYGRYGRAAYGASVLYVFTTTVHTGLLGALFALSSEPFYGVYRDRAAPAGIDVVAHQQLAGVYMWVPAGLILTLFGLALLLAWLSEAERRAAVMQRHILPLVLAPLVATMLAGFGTPQESEARALTGGETSRGRTAVRTYGCDSRQTNPGGADGGRNRGTAAHADCADVSGRGCREYAGEHDAVDSAAA